MRIGRAIIAVAVFAASLLPVCAIDDGKNGTNIYNGKPGTKTFDTCVNPKDDAVMVWVHAGGFTMGDSAAEVASLLRTYPSLKAYASVLESAEPQHKVELQGYWIYKNEVTVAQYRKFCLSTGRQMPKAPDWGWKDSQPMVMVSWQDASDYAAWARVALPTEAQWEMAARGNDGRRYPWGDAWNAAKCANSSAGKVNNACAVSSYPSGSSPYGCMDMAGNAYEWCADWYDPNYYAQSPAVDPTGPLAPVQFAAMGSVFSGARVLRGGSFYDERADSFRCARRYFFPVSSNAYPFFGFRCVVTPSVKC